MLRDLTQFLLGLLMLPYLLSVLALTFAAGLVGSVLVLPLLLVLFPVAALVKIRREVSL